MLSLEDIERWYPEPLRVHKTHILREYLQYKILDSIARSAQAPKLSFLGGTALRLIYNNTRFSEDLDFDNFGLTAAEFASLSDGVRRDLEAEGMRVEISFAGDAAFRCKVRLPELLFRSGLAALQEQKILLQIDTLAHGVVYESELKQLNKFDVFTDVRTTPIDILLAQKLYACANRPRPKGRDFFDILFLLSLNVTPHYGYLEQKLGIANAETLRIYIEKQTAGYDFFALAADVRPFLFVATDAVKVERFPHMFGAASL